MKWIISDITDNAFKQEKIVSNENDVWSTEGIVYAKRKQ